MFYFYRYNNNNVQCAKLKDNEKSVIIENFKEETLLLYNRTLHNDRYFPFDFCTCSTEQI